MPRPMAIVDSHCRLVTIRQGADVGQLHQVAIHRKNRIGENHLESAALRFFELRLQVGHIAVLVAEALVLAEPDAVDD